MITMLNETLGEKTFELPQGWEHGRRKVFGFSVDDASTTDPDDAVYFTHDESGKFLIVSIADTTLLPKKHVTSALDIGATRYASDRIVRSMLHPEISQKILALGGQALTPTISFEIELDPVDNQPINFKIFRGAIEPLRITYDQFNSAIQGDYSRHSRQRERNLKLVELQHAIKGLNKDNHRFRASNATQIIASIMVNTNLLGAQYCNDNNIDILYRAFNSSARAQEAKRDTGERLDSAELELCYGFYTPESIGHADFGDRLYTHLTSPLRRGPDLINLLQIIRHLDGTKPKYTHKQLEGRGRDLTAKYRGAQAKYKQSVLSETTKV
jgi:ribonuclease R